MSRINGWDKPRDCSLSFTVHGIQKLCSSSVVRYEKLSGTSRKLASISWCSISFFNIGFVICNLDHESFWHIDLSKMSSYFILKMDNYMHETTAVACVRRLAEMFFK
jgi:hypothetical protein